MSDGNPVFQKDDGRWYFYGANGQLLGPYLTEVEANNGLNAYLVTIP